MPELVDEIKKSKAGDTEEFNLFRDGKEMTLSITHREASLEELAQMVISFADQEIPYYQNMAGLLYAVGEGVEQDKTMAAGWIRRAAKQGLPAAQDTLARRYYTGSGVEKDYKKAYEWYKKAADQGLDGSKTSLGWMLYQGQGVDRDGNVPSNFFQKQLRRRKCTPQYDLGLMYLYGHHVEQDKSLAVNYFNQAAKQGHCRRIDSWVIAIRTDGELIVTTSKRSESTKKGLKWETILPGPNWFALSVWAWRRSQWQEISNLV